MCLGCLSGLKLFDYNSEPNFPYTLKSCAFKLLRAEKHSKWWSNNKTESFLSLLLFFLCRADFYFVEVRADQTWSLEPHEVWTLPKWVLMAKVALCDCYGWFCCKIWSWSYWFIYIEICIFIYISSWENSFYLLNLIINNWTCFSSIKIWLYQSFLQSDSSTYTIIAIIAHTNKRRFNGASSILKEKTGLIKHTALTHL